MSETKVASKPPVPYVTETYASYMRAMARCKQLSAQHDGRFFVVGHGYSEWEVTNEPGTDETILEYDAGYLVAPIQDSGRDQA